ncbi:MAG TPA: hypothetical protein VFQ68_26280 [Streptosporangiaceae bacterium]|nr:hypothetical protein [Streptosporangiaceae bacterium]
MTMPPVVLSVQASGPDSLASYPVAFTLRDDDGEAVITISDDPAEQHGHLEISNTSGGPLLLDAPPAGATAAAGQYHFELRFRPGVLSATSLTQLRVDEQANWSASAPEQQPDGTVSLYLLSTTGLTFDPAVPLPFRLSALGADGANGARGTQLELRFQLRFADGTPLADTKLLHVDLVNQRGLRNIPLHVGFVGSHTILNDDRTSNTLDVRITNASASDLRLGGRDSSRPSRLVISFDVSTAADGDLGLASASELAALTLEAIDGHEPDRSDWVVEPGRQLGEGLAWTLTHTGTDPVLEAGQVVRIQISNIITASASGDTNLYLRYADIPGYWDGQFVCTLEKGPILFDAQGNVGIETAAPRYRLQVGQGPGALGIDPEGTPVDATYLRFGDNSGHALRVARSQESPGDGPVNSGPAGTLMTVLDDGRVGIGPDAPTAPLTVQADSAGTDEGRQIVVRGRTDGRNELALGYHTGRGYGSIQAVTQGASVRSLLLNPGGGKVGIGVNREPGAALEVNGGIRSPMWRVVQPIGNNSGPLPMTSIPFATGGGTLLLFVSGSAFLPAPGLLGVQVRVDGRLTGTASFMAGQANIRVPLTASMIATGIPAGDGHLITVEVLADAPATRTDSSDLYTVNVLELPF